MRLKYKILWIENEQDWVESIEDQIQDYLYDLGFDYVKRLISKEEDGIDYNNYDLILMDLNLADQPNGAELISKIRELDVYTDVVFYSASGVEILRTYGREKELEGVYYSGRTPDTLFVRKVKLVIDSTIKKVQDLANVRGLVMAEVSELDGKMIEVITKYYVQSETEELKNIFHCHITKKMEERFKKALEGCERTEKVCYHKWQNESIESIIPKMKAAQMANAVNYIIPQDLYSPSRANFFEDYKAEIIEIRNELAHCVSTIEEGREILKTRDGYKTYNEESFREIRKNILKYSEIFTRLLKN